MDLRPTRRLLLAFLAIVLFVGACGDDADDAAVDSASTDEVTSSSSSPADPADDVDEGDASSGEDGSVPDALDFVLDDVRGGDPVDGAAFAGEDLVVWFWAPWCTKCNQEAADIAEVAASRDDVRFLGMAGLDARDAAADFVARHELDGFPHAYDEDGDSWQRFGITSQSSFAFVDDDGSFETVSYKRLGSAEMQRRIDELVAS